ncbi:hypothetical protein [Uliginosibacterium sp. TH139]|uniref:hypothetical protein n=1 Tax=Uliginosibacterium sp. TH139 TaxID=2067453 RepID=UPI00117BFBF9|nr:hypothetical protein [Uliginosibacterium sp. TH139]
MQKSLDQLCVGVYCATALLENSPGAFQLLGRALSPAFVDRGRALLTSNDVPPDLRVVHAWWGCKFDLRKPIRRASDLIIHLGALVEDLAESDDLWTFFPADAPVASLARIASANKSAQANQEGWWFDALMGRVNYQDIQQAADPSSAASRVRKSLNESESRTFLPLPVWAEKIWRSNDPHITKDWRLGEWSCLEIVRQAAVLLSSHTETLDQDYLQRASRNQTDARYECAHPLNFALSSHLINTPAVSWHEWKQKMREPNGQLRRSPQRHRIYDRRYAPLVLSEIGAAQNPIRGLGLCLFALLSRSFLLPAQWNGPGHESMLRHLPQLLQNEITYSTATLGVLGACLQPRASENTFANLYKAWNHDFDDDTEHDPVGLIDTADLARVIEIAQNELEKNQISTFNQQFRQITPVNLMHLTDVDWKRYFDSYWSKVGNALSNYFNAPKSAPVNSKRKLNVGIGWIDKGPYAKFNPAQAPITQRVEVGDAALFFVSKNTHRGGTTINARCLILQAKVGQPRIPIAIPKSDPNDSTKKELKLLEEWPTFDLYKGSNSQKNVLAKNITLAKHHTNIMPYGWFIGADPKCQRPHGQFWLAGPAVSNAECETTFGSLLEHFLGANQIQHAGLNKNVNVGHEFAYNAKHLVNLRNGQNSTSSDWNELCHQLLALIPDRSIPKNASGTIASPGRAGVRLHSFPALQALSTFLPSVRNSRINMILGRKPVVLIYLDIID